VAARLSAQKRINLAIETTAFLASCGHDLPLTIVGDGPERGTLERQVERLGIAPFVRFAGAVPPAEVGGFLARADVMLFPAQGEGFGLAAAEAVMAGVPGSGSRASPAWRSPRGRSCATGPSFARSRSNGGWNRGGCS